MMPMVAARALERSAARSPMRNTTWSRSSARARNPAVPYCRASPAGRGCRAERVFRASQSIPGGGTTDRGEGTGRRNQVPVLRAAGASKRRPQFPGGTGTGAGGGEPRAESGVGSAHRAGPRPGEPPFTPIHSAGSGDPNNSRRGASRSSP